MEIAAGQFFLHERLGKFEHGGSRCHRKTAVSQPQNKHVFEFQPFRRVHGHKLNGVPRFLLQIDLSPRLRKVIKIFNEFRQARSFALELPFTNKLREPPPICLRTGTIYGTDTERDSQPFIQTVKYLSRAQECALFAQFAVPGDQLISGRRTAAEWQFRLRRL